MLGRAAAENVDLSLPLDDLAVVTNRLYGRSNLHNISPKKTSSSNSAQELRQTVRSTSRKSTSFQVLTPSGQSILGVQKIPPAKRSPAQGRQILHISTTITTPPPRREGRFHRFFWLLTRFRAASVKAQTSCPKKPSERAFYRSTAAKIRSETSSTEPTPSISTSKPSWR